MDPEAHSDFIKFLRKEHEKSQVQDGNEENFTKYLQQDGGPADEIYKSTQDLYSDSLVPIRKPFVLDEKLGRKVFKPLDNIYPLIICCQPYASYTEPAIPLPLLFLLGDATRRILQTVADAHAEDAVSQRELYLNRGQKPPEATSHMLAVNAGLLERNVRVLVPSVVRVRNTRGYQSRAFWASPTFKCKKEQTNPEAKNGPVRKTWYMDKASEWEKMEIPDNIIPDLEDAIKKHFGEECLGTVLVAPPAEPTTPEAGK
ncbi:hypothetical protein F4780DRAFT_254221 [Xylariomycetidae sp. FL0641]|nr:hypothetical protein F4780DRAFT_254221 [Xylariomycetidae sp. FL0641]